MTYERGTKTQNSAFLLTFSSTKKPIKQPLISEHDCEIRELTVNSAENHWTNKDYFWSDCCRPIRRLIYWTDFSDIRLSPERWNLFQDGSRGNRDYMISLTVFSSVIHV